MASQVVTRRDNAVPYVDKKLKVVDNMGVIVKGPCLRPEAVGFPVSSPLPLREDMIIHTSGKMEIRVRIIRYIWLITFPALNFFIYCPPFPTY